MKTVLNRFRKTPDFYQKANRYNQLSVVKFEKKEEKLQLQ